MQRAPDRESTGFFDDVVKKYDSIWQTFILPERMTYNPESLGPKTRRLDENTLFHREDMQCLNVRGETIETSLFRIDIKLQNSSINQDTCLVYLHSHGGNRVEGVSLLRYAGALGVNFCCFDFAGSGLSGGMYTTLGLRESQDCRMVIEHLTRKHGMKHFVIWGRSMGAVAALLYASGRQPHLKFMVLDSPFSDIEQMVRDAGNSYISLGEYLAMFLFNMVKDDISKHVGQDLSTFKPLRFCENCTVPGLFLVGKDDPLVLPSRVEEMFNAYQGKPKDMMIIEGTHSSGRSSSDIEKAFKKIEQVFNARMNYSVRQIDGPYYDKFKYSSSVADKLSEIGQEISLNKNYKKIRLTNEIKGKRQIGNSPHQKDYILVSLKERSTEERKKAELKSPRIKHPGKNNIQYIVGPTKVVTEEHLWNREGSKTTLGYMSKINEPASYPEGFTNDRHSFKTPRPSTIQGEEGWKENYSGVNISPFGQYQGSGESIKATIRDYNHPKFVNDSPTYIQKTTIQSDRSNSRPRIFGGILKDQPNYSTFRVQDSRKFSNQPFEPLLSYSIQNNGMPVPEFTSPPQMKQRFARQNSPLGESLAASRITNSNFRPELTSYRPMNNQPTIRQGDSPYVDQVQLRDALKRRLRSKQNSDKSSKDQPVVSNLPHTDPFDLKPHSFHKPLPQGYLQMAPNTSAFTDTLKDRQPRRQALIFDDDGDQHAVRPQHSMRDLASPLASHTLAAKRRPGMYGMLQTGHRYS